MENDHPRRRLNRWRTSACSYPACFCEAHCSYVCLNLAGLSFWHIGDIPDIWVGLWVYYSTAATNAATASMAETDAPRLVQPWSFDTVSDIHQARRWLASLNTAFGQQFHLKKISVELSGVLSGMPATRPSTKPLSIPLVVAWLCSQCYKLGLPFVGCSGLVPGCTEITVIFH